MKNPLSKLGYFSKNAEIFNTAKNALFGRYYTTKRTRPIAERSEIA